jgi:hypothetical protein
MDSQNIQSILQAALENEFPSSQIQLWPAVKASLVAGNYSLVQPEENRKTIKSRRNSRIALVTLVIVALLALVFITPQGRAFARSVLRFFIRANSDTLPVPTEPVTWVEPNLPHPTRTPPPALALFAEDCGDFGDANCSIEQIRSKVDFTVKEPATIPAGMYFIGATGEPDRAFLKYEFENHGGGLYIFEERWSGRPTEGTSEVGASAIVEEVRVGGLAGEYFRGSFVMRDGETTTTWDPDFQAETLRWVDNDISYTLQYDFTTQRPLGKDGLIAIAESLTTEPVIKLPLPATATPDPDEGILKNRFHLSISQAEKLAGFKLFLPPRLPESLSLLGARYEAGAVTVFYIMEEPYMNGLTLSQQLLSNPEECAICDIVVGDGTELGTGRSPMIVDAGSNLEVVQIGNVTGKYVQGVWTGTDCCGWVWDPDVPLHTLRWQADGRAYEITYLDAELDKADLIAIAESLQ